MVKESRGDEEMEEVVKEEFTEEKILSRVYHYRIMNEDDQTSFLLSLDKILRTNKKIKLIYYDPINIH